MRRYTRKQFLGMTLGALGSAALAPAILTAGCSNETADNQGGFFNSGQDNRPNVLLLLMDEVRLPPAGYAPDQGEIPDLREILSFPAQLSPNNSMAPFFKGFLRLRQNAVVLRTHYIAAAACIPSRTTMLTGQYPTVHDVKQTTGTFKEASDPGFVFLDPNGIPTVGDWFQAAGYETHYFGKWHVSQACDSLGPWGFPFGAWDGPEPHGSNPSNMGVYRDVEFANDTVNFLKAKSGNTNAPWFAVASFVNPHDISNWPNPWFLPPDILPFPGVENVRDAPIPHIPSQGTMSNPSIGQPANQPSTCPAPASASIPLNPDGFPQNAFNLPPTVNEDLSTKPSCQFEMAYKVGLALKSNLPSNAEFLSPLPFPLQGDQANAWTLDYGQWWTYLHYLSDLNLRRVLDTLDATGLAKNTIVIYSADHGDYAGAHGQQIQKWHSAYEEAVRVPFVISSPLVNSNAGAIRDLTQPTSHIDLVPTLLGLVGVNQAQQAALKAKITGQGTIPDLVGTDLSPYIRNTGLATPIPGHDGQARPGVLFMTEDEITQMTSLDPNNEGFPAFQRFLGLVEDARKGPVPQLTPGPVTQPACVRSLCSGSFKYSRYYDPSGGVPDQHEFYCLTADPIEAINLVDFRTNQLRPDVSLNGFTTQQLQAQLDTMVGQLAAQEKLLL